MLKNETENIQHQLAKHCRSNADLPIPGAKHERLHHYRRLIYTIIEDAIESAYPIARSILSDNQWTEMIDTFVAEHNCQHPQLFRMPEEVIQFAIDKNYPLKFKIPHLIDVLQFEWAEIEIHSMKDEIIPEITLVNDLLNAHLKFSPYCQLLALDYPVHHLNKIDVANSQGEYFMLVYREESGTVQYLELTALTHYVIVELSSGSSTLKNALDRVISEEENQTELYKLGVLFLKDLRAKGVLLS